MIVSLGCALHYRHLRITEPAIVVEPVGHIRYIEQQVRSAWSVDTLDGGAREEDSIMYDLIDYFVIVISRRQAKNPIYRMRRNNTTFPPGILGRLVPVRPDLSSICLSSLANEYVFPPSRMFPFRSHHHHHHHHHISLTPAKSPCSGQDTNLISGSADR